MFKKAAEAAGTKQQGRFLPLSKTEKESSRDDLLRSQRKAEEIGPAAFFEPANLVTLYSLITLLYAGNNEYLFIPVVI